MRKATWREGFLVYAAGVGGLLLGRDANNNAAFLVIALAVFSITGWILCRESKWMDK